MKKVANTRGRDVILVDGRRDAKARIEAGRRNRCCNWGRSCQQGLDLKLWLNVVPTSPFRRWLGGNEIVMYEY